MNKWTLLAFSLPLACPLYADVLNVDSHIDSVNVYPGMAKVTRTFSVDLPAGGRTELRFEGLPENLDSANVLIGVNSGVPLTFGTVSFDDEFSPEDQSQAFLDAQEALKTLEAKRSVLQQKRMQVNDHAMFLLKLYNSLNTGIGEAGTLELYTTSLEALDAAEKAQQEAFEVSENVDKELSALEEDIELARKACDKLKARDHKLCADYTVNVVSSGGMSTGTISYYISGPTWAPSYQANADTNASNLELEYRAGVYQDSGEDWSNVTLTLETSRPERGAVAREPSVVYLSKREVNPRYESRLAMTSVPKASYEAEDDDVIYLAPFGGDKSNAVIVSPSMAGFKAEIKERVNIPSSENSTSLTILKRSMDCDFHSETIPMTAESAFLIAELKSSFPMPLLSGPMQAVVDGTTNGTGEIEETLPGQDLTIGLGINQNVVVQRKVIAEKGKDSGIFGSRRVEDRYYVHTITNHMSVSQRVVLKDRVPLSKEEKIEVKLLLPEKVEIDPETGLFEQEVTLQPGESIELPSKFRVSYPSDWSISGSY